MPPQRKTPSPVKLSPAKVLAPVKQAARVTPAQASNRVMPHVIEQVLIDLLFLCTFVSEIFPKSNISFLCQHCKAHGLHIRKSPKNGSNETGYWFQLFPC